MGFILGADFLFSLPALIPMAIFGSLYAWARWLRGRRMVPRVAAGVAPALLALAACMTVAFPVLIFVVAPSGLVGRARHPDEEWIVTLIRVDEACVAALVVGIPIWLLYATWRWHWSAHAARLPEGPPYR